MNKISAIALLLSGWVFSQQKISLAESEAAFKQNNLQLLAEQYNVSQADADILQAKIWNLPEFGFSANLINPEKRTVLDVGPTKTAQLSQLFLLGGKRQKQVDFAKTNKELAQLQLNQLLVDLRSQLRETFYTIYFDQKKILSIENQLGYMTSLLNAYRVQSAKGNVSLKDEVRLNSIVISLKNDKATLQNEIVANQNTLKILTGIPQNLDPEIAPTDVQQMLSNQPLFSLDDLQQKALENNADYLFALKATESNTRFLAWQKSLNVPDVTAGLNWNQNSGIYHNEINFSINIPIPLWKQNQGNIEKAKLTVDQSEKTAALKKLTLESQVAAAYQTWHNQHTLLASIPQRDLDDLDTVYKGMTENFRRGNVTLIEFTDFIDSYKQSVFQINELNKQMLISSEELNRLVQTPLF